MRWLLLRGLSREKRHFGGFPSTFERLVHGAGAFTIDLPGFGTEHARESPATIGGIVDDVRGRFVRERPGDAGEPWGIFAVSLGGMVALDWAARFPSDFQRVVVANTSAADLSPPWERFSTSLWRKLPRLVGRVDPVARERAILEITSNAGSVDKDAVAAEWARYYVEKTPMRRSFARQLVAAARSRAPARVPSLLVLTSRADRLVSFKCSERIAKKLAAPIAYHDEAGHDLSLDAPEWICARIQETAA